jgi:hypothetical protein
MRVLPWVLSRYQCVPAVPNGDSQTAEFELASLCAVSRLDHLTLWNSDCVCAENTEAGLALDADDFPVECTTCSTDKSALQGGRCCCKCKAERFLVYGLGRGSQQCSASLEDTCVVNRRLPPFAFRPGHRVPSGAALLQDQGREAQRLASGFGSAPPPSARRSPGGVCHMGPLPIVENKARLDSNLSHALQLCAQTPGSEELTCKRVPRIPKP